MFFNLTMFKPRPNTILFILFIGIFNHVVAQNENNRTTNNVTYDRNGRPINNFKAGADTSLRRRDINEDSLTIFYKYYNGMNF